MTERILGCIGHLATAYNEIIKAEDYKTLSDDDKKVAETMKHLLDGMQKRQEKRYKLIKGGY